MHIPVRKTFRRAFMSLESFLSRHKITIEIEFSPHIQGNGRYVVAINPYLAVKTGEGSHTTPYANGSAADFCIRKFISEISGKQISLDRGQSYFFAPQLEWDGILRVEVKKVRRAKKATTTRRR